MQLSVVGNVQEINGDTDLVRVLVRTLRKRIVAWQYPPQYPLIEDSLAREFDVSRSPIRQALTHLAAEGLLERLPRKGFRVRQMQLSDVKDLYEFRLALESQIVGSLAQKGLSQEDFILLQNPWLNDSSLAAKSTSELAALDEAFHAGLAKAHGNSLLFQHLIAINERLFAFREIDFAQHARVDSTCKEHLGILHAILSRNAEDACRLIGRNIYSGLGNVESVIIQLVARSYLNPTNINTGDAS